MTWKNLLKNQCPKCKAELDFESDTNMMMCTISCGFMIASEKMRHLCASMNADLLLKRKSRPDNGAALEAFGRTRNPFEDPED